MPDCSVERASGHVWWFTPDDRTDRTAIVSGGEGSVLFQAGASATHSGDLLHAREPLGLAPFRAAVLTHRHRDPSFGGVASLELDFELVYTCTAG